MSGVRLYGVRRRLKALYLSSYAFRRHRSLPDKASLFQLTLSVLVCPDPLCASRTCVARVAIVQVDV